MLRAIYNPIIDIIQLLMSGGSTQPLLLIQIIIGIPMLRPLKGAGLVIRGLHYKQGLLSGSCKRPGCYYSCYCYSLLSLVWSLLLLSLLLPMITLIFY